MTVAGDAAASAAGVGNSAMKRVQCSAALAAWVCWAMTSETRTAHGSVVLRKARSRPFAAYQSRTARWIAARFTSLRYGGEIRRCLLDPADRLAVAPGCGPRGRARRLRQPVARRSPPRR